MNKILSRPETKQQLLEYGFDPGGGTRQQLTDFTQAERRKWEPLIKASGTEGGLADAHARRPFRRHREHLGEPRSPPTIWDKLAAADRTLHEVQPLPHREARQVRARDEEAGAGPARCPA